PFLRNNDTTGLEQYVTILSSHDALLILFGPDSKHQGAFELGMGLATLKGVIRKVRLVNSSATLDARVGWFCSVSKM
ncbi:hypothetical protein, partial [Pseudomonas aeruginosa]